MIFAELLGPYPVCIRHRPQEFHHAAQFFPYLNFFKLPALSRRIDAWIATETTSILACAIHEFIKHSIDPSNMEISKSFKF